MKEILQLLLDYGTFLFDDYKFVDSLTTTSFGGDAFLVLASDDLRLRFVRDRGELFLDFQGTSQSDKDDWHSIDVVQALLTGENQDSAVLTAERMAFVSAQIKELERRFGADELENTQSRLKELERKRAKDLFG